MDDDAASAAFSASSSRRARSQSPMVEQKKTARRTCTDPITKYPLRHDPVVWRKTDASSGPMVAPTPQQQCSQLMSRLE